MARVLGIAISLFLVAFAWPALLADERPKVPRDETLDVPSLTLTTEQFLRGDITHGLPVTLTGDLRTPNWGRKPARRHIASRFQQRCRRRGIRVAQLLR